MHQYNYVIMQKYLIGNNSTSTVHAKMHYFMPCFIFVYIVSPLYIHLDFMHNVWLHFSFIVCYCKDVNSKNFINFEVYPYSY
jgi:hypothetical protein